MTTEERASILVIGAGPAGAAAAIEARAAGSDVIVIDRATFPRDKCCGDGLTTGALRQLEELGIDVPSLASTSVVDSVVLVGPDRRSREFPLPRGVGLFAAVTRRRELDAALVATARQSGADVREHTSVVAIEDLAPVGRTGAMVTVESDHKRYSIVADHVVAADGMWSPTRRLLGVNEPGYRGTWHAFRQYFTNVGARARSELIVWFEPDLLPGYVWSFPLGDGSANVGFGILRDRCHRVQDMGKLWPDILARPHVREVLGPDAEPEDRHTAWPIPADLGHLPLSSGCVLFAGDAAAATDPLTGEGIGQALETGRLAVQSIVEAGADATEAAARYEKDLKATLIPDHRLARLLSVGLSTQRGARASLAVAGATDWTRRNFARWLFEDYPRATLATPQRWQRDVFTRPGAYR